jgi:phage tail-like protein
MACPANTLINGKNRFYVTAVADSGAETFIGNVKQVGGIESEIEVTEWKSGDRPNAVKIPGTVKFPPITLHRGFDKDHFLSNWYAALFDPDTGNASDAFTCRTMYIYVLDRNGNIFRKVQISDAWPSKYTGDELDATSNDPWMEVVEIQHSGWKYVAGEDTTWLTSMAGPFNDALVE